MRTMLPERWTTDKVIESPSVSKLAGRLVSGHQPDALSTVVGPGVLHTCRYFQLSRA
jgi:hypothetical protein